MTTKQLLLIVVFFSSINALGARIVKIAGGYGHSCALTDEGTLYCWGQNGLGQLATGDPLAKTRPVKIPNAEKIVDVASAQDHVCAVLQSGNVKCWGSNNNGQLGMGTTNPAVGNGFNQALTKLPVLKLGKDLKVKSVALGALHSCALFDDGRIKCWGNNASGSLGLGDVRNRGTQAADMGDNLPFVNLGDGAKVTKLSLGTSFSCALLETNEVKCWGIASAIGSGSTTNLGTLPTHMGNNLLAVKLDVAGKGQVKDIVTGQAHACALLTDGRVKCWGINNYGVLGVGKATVETIGDVPSEMGSGLGSVSVASGMRIETLTSGLYHVCAIVENSALKCWGLNSVAQLGAGDLLNRGTAVEQMGDNLPYVDIGAKTEINVVHSGFYHTCAILDRDVKCWGWNAFGQLGIGNNITIGSSPTQMGDELVPTSFEGLL